MPPGTLFCAKPNIAKESAAEHAGFPVHHPLPFMFLPFFTDENPPECTVSNFNYAGFGC
jgi:hypothetical protein